jgi:uncharacterized protein YndB with AHSA1/START domain
MDRIERRVELSASPEEVWPALSEGPRLSGWFGAHVDLEPSPGGRATFRWPDGRERGAIVEAVEHGRRLAFRWHPFERSPGGAVTVVGSGRVELVLEPSGSGSTLTVTEWGTETRSARELLRA